MWNRQGLEPDKVAGRRSLDTVTNLSLPWTNRDPRSVCQTPTGLWGHSRDHKMELAGREKMHGNTVGASVQGDHLLGERKDGAES